MFTFSTLLRRVAISCCTALAVAILPSLAFAQQQSPRILCGDGDSILRNLADKHKEFRVAQGIITESQFLPEGALVEISANEGGTSISVLVTKKASCFVLSNTANTKWWSLSGEDLDSAIAGASAPDDTVKYVETEVRVVIFRNMPGLLTISADADMNWTMKLFLPPVPVQAPEGMVLLPHRTVILAQGVAWSVFSPKAPPTAPDVPPEAPLGTES
jgi:hypothetical protein